MSFEFNFKIAVFTMTQREFDDLLLKPKNRFKRIRDSRDIRAENWQGVIVAGGLYRISSNRNVIDAYDEFRAYKPELFKDEDQ